jgi:cullin-4
LSLTATALDEAMDSSDQDALIRLHRFVDSCEVFAPFVSAMEAHVKVSSLFALDCRSTDLKERLTTLISNPENDARMIEATVALKRFADTAVRTLFKEDDTNSPISTLRPAKTFQQNRAQEIELEDAIRVGFKAGMGSRQNAPAEWIGRSDLSLCSSTLIDPAKHLDTVMRKGQGSGTEAEFNTLLDEIIALIGFTKDKDVFKAFYSTQLAKRLLLNKSASDDMERNMIIKLQKEMGEEFTSGDVMMKDLALSET